MTRYVVTLTLDDPDDRWGTSVIEEWVSNATFDNEKNWAAWGVHFLSLNVEAEHSVALVRRCEATIKAALNSRGEQVGWAHLGGITEYVEHLDGGE